MAVGHSEDSRPHTPCGPVADLLIVSVPGAPAPFLADLGRVLNEA